jgi:hypothetical protein
MLTPYGKECKFYYQDFHRGRSLVECRLLGPGAGWAPKLCRDCPVPGILLANACPEMILSGKVNAGILGLGRRVLVATYCRLSHQSGFDPHLGCSECHKALHEIHPPAK